jgi:hypothetical protein
MGIPLKTRRMWARGLNKRQASKLGGRYFWGIGNRATLTTALSGANNDVMLIARTPGTAGNSIRFRIVVSGASTAASVAVSGSDITFNSATSAGSAAISTANDVVRYLLADASASALVWTQLAHDSDGSGVVTALAFTNLAGAS